MSQELIEYLHPRTNNNYIDATLGEGGHSKLILKNIVSGKILAIDQSLKSINKAKLNLKKYSRNIIYVNDNFANLDKIVKKNKFCDIDGIIYDFGLASWQIDDSKKGISFSKNEILDMRLRDEQANLGYRLLSADKLVNTFTIKKIANILYTFGDIRNSWAVARKIDIARKQRPIKTTYDLVRALETKNPKILAPIFQALRIYINDELKNIEKSLNIALDVLSSNGRIVAISFHSGEDRIVKNIFRNRLKVKKDIKILTKKPILPKINEIKNNPRSRSAKLRAIIKL
jgi:16S rRNA (cytosine1402-N4)-methyltransferase